MLWLALEPAEAERAAPAPHEAVAGLWQQSRN
jgi:hypothetical protein